MSFALVAISSVTVDQRGAAAESLLSPSQRELPADTGSDGKSKLSIALLKEISGSVLRVDFSAGDSFGGRVARVRDWTAFETLSFQGFNPSAKPVKLELNVFHRRTTTYQTRVVHRFSIGPGKSQIDLQLRDLRNVDQSVPDLSEVGRWYIAVEPEATPTLYFGDLVLTAASKTAASAHAIDIDHQRLERLRAAKMPLIDRVIDFDTPAADAVLSALEVFPPENPWNAAIAHWPRHERSREIVAAIGSDKPMRINYDMSFIIVPPSQQRVPVEVIDYPHESDSGPFPVPANTPIEGWPRGYAKRGITLEDLARNKLNEDFDRHAIVVDPVNKRVYEFFQMRKTDSGWKAAQASIFDLTSNALRPNGWTSADAAGLPIFPAVVRYDELERGVIEHALRVTVPRSRKAFVYPATHQAGHTTDIDFPRMGERLRLRRDFDISGFSRPAQTILQALKTYGMFVADNGREWSISVTPDNRIPDLNQEFRKIRGSDFEVVRPPDGYQPPR